MNRKLPYRGAGCLLYVTGSQGQTVVYLGKRRIRPGLKKWSIPGGKREERDGSGRHSAWVNARRETIEETGIEPKKLEPEKGQRHPSIGFRLLLFEWDTFLVRVSEPLPLGYCSEFSEGGWFPLDATPTPLAFGMGRALACLRRALPRAAR